MTGTHTIPSDTLAPWAEIVPDVGPVAVDDLLTMPEDGWRYEVVAGVLVRMAGSGDLATRIAATIIIVLGAFVRPRRLGRITGADGVYKFQGAHGPAPRCRVLWCCVIPARHRQGQAYPLRARVGRRSRLAIPKRRPYGGQGATLSPWRNAAHLGRLAACGDDRRVAARGSAAACEGHAILQDAHNGRHARWRGRCAGLLSSRQRHIRRLIALPLLPVALEAMASNQSKGVFGKAQQRVFLIAPIERVEGVREIIGQRRVVVA